MHFHMEATLMWSMPLDHSGITHEVVGKNWPDLSKRTIDSKSPRCLCILYFAHAYAHLWHWFVTKKHDSSKRQHHIWHVSICVHFFFFTLTLLSTSWKMRFTWIFLNNHPFKDLAMNKWPLEASLSPCQCNFQRPVQLE